MFGIELIEFLAFGKQVGIAVAGAAAVWGFVFRRADKRIASKLLLALFGGVAVAFVFWFGLLNLVPASAHEGITLAPSLQNIYRALELFMPVYMGWFLFSLGGLVWWRLRKEKFLRFLPWFFVLELAFALVLASFPVWLGEFSRAQLFFVGHNVHSIFTFGTVAILDYLFLISQRSPLLQQQIFPKFMLISKVVWAGLGFDFLSVLLVFEEALQLTPKFFFMQTIIGVLIINGVLLAGPFARRFEASVKAPGPMLGKKWRLAGELAGTVSISSWFTITFIDFFHRLTLEYYHFLGLYLVFITLLFFAHLLFETLRPKTEEIGRL